MSMVYYNSLPMYQKSHGSNLGYSPTPTHHSWYSGNYPPPHTHPNAQFLGPDTDITSQAMYYNSHAMFHHQTSPDWPAHDNFTSTQNALLQSGVAGLHIGGGGNGPPTNAQNSAMTGSDHHLSDGLHNIPSPPITVSGSEISSPGAPNGGSSPQISGRPAPVKSPYEWMKKPSYQNQPHPGSESRLQDFSTLDAIGKTRTKDKYRVVYTDYQRLELEKEYHTSRYITIRRKSELAQSLQLSERQVKIWFQNRRAKERKQTKKRDDPPSQSVHLQSGGGIGGIGIPGIGGSIGCGPSMDIKPKIEPGLHHLQHPALHQMSAMGLQMSSIRFDHSHHPNHPLHPNGHHFSVAGGSPVTSGPPVHHQSQASPTITGI